MVITISKQAAIENIKEYFKSYIDKSMYECDVVDCSADIIKIVEKIGFQTNTELKILMNHIEEMPRIYRKRNVNWVIVQSLLMQGTPYAGRSSSVQKCYELGINPYSYEIEGML